MKKLITNLVALLVILPVVSMADGGFGPGSKSLHQTEISGQVIDKDSKEELVCATISLKGTDVKVSTDVEGKFSIKGLDPGIYTIEVSYISYKSSVIRDAKLTQNDSKEIIVQLEQLD
jgi:hypothetical protein